MAQQANQYLNELQQLGINLIAGSGAPSLTAIKGTIYINTTASTSSTRLYINTDGAATWASFTASA